MRLAHNSSAFARTNHGNRRLRLTRWFTLLLVLTGVIAGTIGYAGESLSKHLSALRVAGLQAKAAEATKDAGRTARAAKFTAGPVAASITVTNAGDGAANAANCPGTGASCRLRDAIAASAAGDTIAFSNTTAGGAVNFFDGGMHTITLDTGDLLIDKSLTITGPGAKVLTVERNSAAARFRIFTIASGTVEISGITITKGFTADGPFAAGVGGPGVPGGGISNNGTLTLTGVAVSGNRTGNGGGSNVVDGGNGGSGGGIFNGAGTLTINNSTISANQTGGGGLHGQMGLDGRGGVGGGIHNDLATLIIKNSTISGNQMGLGSGFSGGDGGGGIYNNGTLTVGNSTVTANTAPQTLGGGIHSANGTVTLRSTIVGGNSAPTGPDVAGSVASDGFNLIANTSGATITPNGGAGPDITGVSPQLNALADNGGPTQTHRLLNTSPAIDKGDDFSATPTNDQRGVLRPFDDPLITNPGDGTDIGAYELQGTAAQSAPPFVVNTADDHDDGAGGCTVGDCTLREAITAANATAGTDTITFDIPGAGPHIIQLTTELPFLSDSVNILNTSGELVTVSGEGAADPYRIFTINSGKTVNISGLTIANGKVSGNPSQGGGIFNDGTLTLSDCTLSGNTSSSSHEDIKNFGGAILNNGTLTINNSTLSGNSATGFGDYSHGRGGGIYNNAGTLTITNSTLSGNSATAGASGIQTVSRGGGIYIAGGTVTIINSTLSGNSATSVGNGGGTSQGAAIYAAGGTLTLTNGTLSGNSAVGGSLNQGGGILNEAGTVNARNTISAGNTATTAPDIFGTFNSQGHNLVGDATGATVTPTTGDQFGTSASPIDPKLAPLANYGGATQTMRPIIASPAIDSGDDCVFNNSCSPVLVAALTIDQRGFTRKAGAHVDIGAVETNYTTSATAGTPQSTVINTVFATQLQATVTESGNPINGVTVTFTAPASGASGTFQGTGTNTATATTGSNGVATAPVFTANSSGGSFSVIASIGAGLPTATFNLTNNTPPTVNAAGGLSRQQGSPVTNSQIATVTDDGGNGSVAVTIASANPSNGVTISGIGNTGGNITANIIADCSATNASFTLQASDGVLTATATLNITVTGNSPPTLSYANPPALAFNGSTTVTPATATDNGPNTVYSVQSVVPSLTTAPTVNASGVVSITNAQPGGTHTITIRATDNCGAIKDASLILDVSKAFANPSVTSSVNPADLNQSVTFTATLTGPSGTGTPTGTVQFKDGGTNLGAPVTLNASGAAQLTTSTLTTGNHNITADYSGDTNFVAVTGTLAGGQVVKVQPTLSINDVSIAEGQSGTSTLNFTATLSAASSLPVTANYATANGTATAPSDYTAIASTLLTFNPGDTSKTVAVTINGDISFEPDETFTVNLSNPTNASISKPAGTGTIQNDDAQGGFFSFSPATYNVNEATGLVTVTVIRTNNVTQAATVDYATDDTGAPTNCGALNTGLASQRCDYTSVFGTLRFAANETQKTIDIPINLDAYTEGPENFTVKLSNPTGGAALMVPASAMVTINDSSSPTPNAIDDTGDFVRQQYHDFLNRDADPAGLAFWKNNIDKCNDPAQRPVGQTLAQCLEVQRIVTSAAFFLSIEFRQTGGMVGDFYVASLFRPLTDNMPDFVEFMRDTQAIQRGVVVNQANWQQTLDTNRLAFMNEFVMRPEFVGLYPTTDTPTQYVNKIYQHAALAPAPGDRAAVIAEFGAATTADDPAARARALLLITQDPAFQARELPRGFVQMQYFGYLRRNPNDLPDNNFAGYGFWLDKLIQFNGDFLKAEMVKAFLLSSEYRQRFGP